MSTYCKGEGLDTMCDTFQTQNQLCNVNWYYLSTLYCRDVLISTEIFIYLDIFINVEKLSKTLSYMKTKIYCDY